MNQFDAAERRAKAFGLDVRSLKFDHLPYDFDAAFAASSPVVVTTRSCELAQVSDSGSNSSNVFFGSNDYVQRFR
jgi:hypothetical protein